MQRAMLLVALCSSEDAVVPARGKAMVATGLSIKCPPGTYGRVAPRSGLTWKNAIDTGAGVIDEDYRGEVKVILFNHSDVEFQSAFERLLVDFKLQAPMMQCTYPHALSWDACMGAWVLHGTLARCGMHLAHAHNSLLQALQHHELCICWQCVVF